MLISIVDLPASITPLLRPGNSLIATREGKDMSNRYVIPFLRDDEVDRLDAAENALLAPVRSEGGEDRRRKLPREYFEKKPSRFLTKFLFALGMIALSWVVIAANLHWSATMLAIAVAGLMYAHLVELQHECLHEHAFRLPGVARHLDAKKIRSEYRHDQGIQVRAVVHELQRPAHGAPLSSGGADCAGGGPARAHSGQDCAHRDVVPELLSQGAQW